MMIKIRCDKTACKRESVTPECEQFYLLSVQGVWSSFGFGYFEACNSVIGCFCSIVDVLLHLEEANAPLWFHERLACTDTAL